MLNYSNQLQFRKVGKEPFPLHSAAAAKYQKGVKYYNTIDCGVYPLLGLSTLLNKINVQDTKQFGMQPGKVVNFILKENGELVFGDGKINLNGHLTGKKIEGEKKGPFFIPKRPKDYKCHAAGKLLFNEQNQIIGISNQSEDFRPSFDSLQFAVQALFEAEGQGTLQIADEIIVGEHGEEEAQRIDYKQILKEELKNALQPENLKAQEENEYEHDAEDTLDSSEPYLATDYNNSKNLGTGTTGVFKPIPRMLLNLSSERNQFDKKREISSNPIIYSIKDVGVLLNGAKLEQRHDISPSNVKVVRFLLTKDDKLVFGQEGAPSSKGTTPAHYQMAQDRNNNQREDMTLLQLAQRELKNPTQCVTAGNLFFNENNELIGIDHKSGDFRPAFDTLQFACQQLLANNEIKIANELMLIKLNEETGAPEQYHKVSIDKLRQPIRDWRDNPCVINVEGIRQEGALKKLLKSNKEKAQERWKIHVEVDVNKPLLERDILLIGAAIATSGILLKVEVEKPKLVEDTNSPEDNFGYPTSAKEDENIRIQTFENKLVVKPEPHQAQKFYHKIIEQITQEVLKKTDTDKNSLSFQLENDPRYANVKKAVAATMQQKNEYLKSEQQKAIALWRKELEKSKTAIKNHKNDLRKNFSATNPVAATDNETTDEAVLNKAIVAEKKAAAAWHEKPKTEILKDEKEFLKEKIAKMESVVDIFSENSDSPTQLVNIQIRGSKEFWEHYEYGCALKVFSNKDIQTLKLLVENDTHSIGKKANNEDITVPIQGKDKLSQALINKINSVDVTSETTETTWKELKFNSSEVKQLKNFLNKNEKFELSEKVRESSFKEPRKKELNKTLEGLAIALIPLTFGLSYAFYKAFEPKQKTEKIEEKMEKQLGKSVRFFPDNPPTEFFQNSEVTEEKIRIQNSSVGEESVTVSAANAENGAISSLTETEDIYKNVKLKKTYNECRRTFYNKVDTKEQNDRRGRSDSRSADSSRPGDEDLSKEEIITPGLG